MKKFFVTGENVSDAGNIDAGVDVGTTVAEVTVSIEFRL